MEGPHTVGLGCCFLKTDPPFFDTTKRSNCVSCLVSITKRTPKTFRPTEHCALKIFMFQASSKLHVAGKGLSMFNQMASMQQTSKRY